MLTAQHVWYCALLNKCESTSLQICLNALRIKLSRNSRFALALFTSQQTAYNMAQSAMARSPLGVNFFWDKGHQPELEWEKWLATVKLAIMVKENIHVDKLLQSRPENDELDYPSEPHYEPALSDETTAERRQREQRNVKKKNRLAKHL